MPRGDGKGRKPAAQRRLDTVRAVHLAMAGATIDAIASDLGVDYKTVRTWIASPDGQREVELAIREVRDRSTRMLATLHVQALRTLAQAMTEAPRWSDRIAAARSITDMSRHIEITGANGGAIEVEVETLAMLDDRVAQIAERLAGADIIDVEPTPIRRVK